MDLYAPHVLDISESKSDVLHAIKNPIIFQTELCLTAARNFFVRIAIIEPCLFALDAIDIQSHMNSSTAKMYAKYAPHKKIESANSASLHSQREGVEYAESAHTIIF
ncbi:MAG: hypothetical protein IE909_06825 [Campylobacterales bacterium]|uniref:hypothetical protein n=1 Tax=Sulfurimonas sp. TaxID=2022749 RepID=UPI0019C6AF08|nr:hypothetical protein [Sulfurimonas sp.]MBD3797199.1 hypothetical protein [Campylobacterales bacterium]MBD3823305.1 hypothetical protein [Campylobacterota bacterium]MBD3841588.1 hypothetical protein [Campylobacterales bacterium]MDD2653248.1 hypothetical protein [Sulfurimonas sp.]MDD3452289.1 hypothetical protein [Sulfurimonas sp.]